MHPLTSISPIDGRYQENLEALEKYFSESALMRYRIRVEIEYLLALSREPKVKEVKRFSSLEAKKLRSLYEKFNLADAKQVKIIESKTNHDVKAIEYFIKEKLSGTSFKKQLEFIHFGLTSEDINNLAYSLMLRDALVNEYVPLLEKLLATLKTLARQYKRIAILSLTHGQPATPTTLGKELAVFYYRLGQQLTELKKIKLLGKLNGATGNFAALNIAYPQVNWPEFSKKYVESLGLAYCPLTTQIEGHDTLAQSYDNIKRINSIVYDLDQDMWFYISRKIFKQKPKKAEVGSSTMPHKINPIYFENSEGNIGIANALLEFLARKLPVSRQQRDLTDSTVLRNQGVAVAHSILAYQNTLKGLSRVEVNKPAISEELDSHPEVLAEAIQTILRKVGYGEPYEKLKELTRGHQITENNIKEFVKGLKIDKKEKNKLLKLKPENYTGLSERLVDKYLK